MEIFLKSIFMSKGVFCPNFGCKSVQLFLFEIYLTNVLEFYKLITNQKKIKVRYSKFEKQLPLEWSAQLFVGLFRLSFYTFFPFLLSKDKKVTI